MLARPYPQRERPVPDPLPFITYAFVMSITPGPNNVMLTASGARFGFRRTVPHLLGIVCGFTVQLLTVCAGLSALFSRWPALQTTLSWVGALYLLYLGWRLLSSSAARAHAQARPVRFFEAAMFQFLNPKAWVMSITSATLFLPQELGVLLRGAYMALVMEGVGLPCMAVWALFGSSLRSFIAAPRGRRVFNGTMALALATTAVMMVR
jgi:threonine/homoserine/homoserine lactone efflux protein